MTDAMDEAEDAATRNRLVALSGGALAATSITTSAEAAAETRSRLKELRQRMDMAYFETGFLLLRVTDQLLFKRWGYDTFKAYVETELGFKEMKARYLVQIWRVFGEQIRDQYVTARILEMGWGKAKELARVCGPENARWWVDHVAGMNIEAVEQSVRAAIRDKNVEVERLAAASLTPDGVAPRNDLILARAREELAAIEMTQSGGVYEPVALPQVPDLSVPDPVSDESWIEVRIRMTHEHKLNLFSAVALAKDIASTSNTSVALDLIATAFRSMEGGSRSIVDVLALMERAWGLKIIAFRPKQQDVVYGHDYFAELAKAGEEP